MANPKITWYVKQQDLFVPESDYYAGSFSAGDTVRLSLQIWNNRWGIAAVDSLANAVLNMKFDTLEDSSLLPSVQVLVNDTDIVPVLVKNMSGSAPLGVNLSGAANNGDETNRTNYVSVIITISLTEGRFKPNDLKNLYFDIVSLG